MDKDLLQSCLRRELDLWSAKSYDALVTELRDVVAYSVGQGPECYQVEVDRLECTPEYVHVCISVDDGRWRAFVPLCASFLVHRNGRVDKPDLGDDQIYRRAPLGHGAIRRAVAAWLVLIAVEFIHGILRAILLVPVVGDFRARQIGVFTGSLLILLVAYVCVPWLRARTARALIQVGVLWLVLTVAFEFSFGHYVFRRSWRDLVSDYDLPHGGLLPIGLVVLALSPVIAARLRGRRAGARSR